ncbi:MULTISPECIES: hypothetical protein [Mesonia]|uniref:Uncharacterized protein n=1 Tax=Mesonia oceanica TaxID=2687242 RepID=A0AC61Y5G6_9FLAO|nr:MULTISPECIES: hypothetical protein [Mesonia]MAN26530.1 hypothetical protein [Mesonia sp.]MAQ40798.1 hypothetical protein [Mesonia sp.]MBJ97719.1 hypothetical protein [Flavobacteriaceae bacterium]VVU99424.1 hypothetical protein FVB9532_00678 [Mesonia oceanica]|tara:strand:- start:14299 stop:14730 length:432 start_codon:yes stop_codon:yes gene_type:complete
MKTLFTKSQVENLLPQKEPFAMVETLLEKENELFSTLMISADNLLVEQGCFSEAGLLEFMAQSIAVFSAYHSTEQEKEAQMGFIGAIKKAEILSLPKVGTQIFGKVDKQFEAIGIQLAKVEVFNSSQERLAWAEIKTVLSSSK